MGKNPQTPRAVKTAWQMFMFKWGLHPQTPEPAIARAMLTESFQKITSNPSITRPIAGRNPRTSKEMKSSFFFN
jgi:hypothetical protein